MEIVQWKDISTDLHQLNPSFVEAIDSLKGVNKFSCIKVRYPFGATVINRGEYHMHHAGVDLPFKSARVPRDAKALLKYQWQSVPFGMVTRGAFESHSDYGNTIVPYRLKRPGKTFSLLTIYDNPYLVANLWTEVAGCRSMIILPKITQQTSLDALRHLYDVDIDHTKDFTAQWNLFKELANSSNFKRPWQAEMMLFSYEFMEQLSKNVTVREGLLHNLWRNCSFSLNLRSYEFLWSMCLTELQNKESLPNAVLQDPLIIETAKHLVKIAVQTTPGYVPATDNTSGPISELMRVFMQDYKIRFRLPTFMILDRYDGKSPVYYTMSHHIFAHAHPATKNYNRETVTDLNNIREIVLRFVDFILSSGSGHDLTKTILHKHLSKVEFDFFHPKGKQYICNDPSIVCEQDPRFTWIPENINMKKRLDYASASLFFNGCIRIRPKG